MQKEVANIFHSTGTLLACMLKRMEVYDSARDGPPIRYEVTILIKKVFKKKGE